MTTTPARTGHRYSCVHSIALSCDRGDGRPPRKACRHCGGAFLVEAGFYGLFTWIPGNTARYPRENAVGRLYANRETARKATDGTDLVVRWVPADET